MTLTRWSPLWLLLLAFCSQAKTILVVESYHAEYLWDQSYKQGLEDTLGASHKLVYFEMDTKRLPVAQHAQRAEAAWQQYLRLKPDLVVLADDNALKYIGPKLLNTDTPVVYLGINANPRTYGIADAPNFSGVMERPLLIRSILMLKKFNPANRVLLVLDDSETSGVLKEDIYLGKDALTIAGVYIELKRIKHFSHWKTHVLTAKEQQYDALIVGLYHTLTNEQGQHVNVNEVIEWTSENTQVPPFGFWDFSIGTDKNIGGYVIFGYEEGKLAGKIALVMLKGRKTRVGPTTGGQGRFVFSKRQLLKWKITLPSDVYKKTTFVE